MIRFIILVLLCYLLYRVVKHIMSPPQKAAQPYVHSSAIITDEMVKDPVCHLYLPKRDAVSAQIAHETLYFCSDQCKKKYLEEKFPHSLQSPPP